MALDALMQLKLLLSKLFFCKIDSSFWLERPCHLYSALIENFLFFQFSFRMIYNWSKDQNIESNKHLF